MDANELEKLIEQGSLNINGCPNFNDFDKEDQRAITWIYATKLSQNELDPEYIDPIKGLDKCATEYRATRKEQHTGAS